MIQRMYAYATWHVHACTCKTALESIRWQPVRCGHGRPQYSVQLQSLPHQDRHSFKLGYFLEHSWRLQMLVLLGRYRVADQRTHTHWAPYCLTQALNQSRRNHPGQEGTALP